MISFAIENMRFNYRCAAIFHDKGRVLLYRGSPDDFWILPGGRCEVGETARQAVEREMMEELGEIVVTGRLCFLVENFFTYQGCEVQETSMYFNAEFSRDSHIPTRDGSWQPHAEPGAEFRWFLPEEVASLTLKPDVFGDRLFDLPREIEHIVVDDRSNRPETPAPGPTQRDNKAFPPTRNQKMNDIELLRGASGWAREQMAATAGHDWGHIERVLANATHLAREEGADLLVVQLAAVMHDVVNLSKDHPERRAASTKSAEFAAGWLQGRLSKERIALVFEAIKCHSFSAGFVPESLEAKVVSDADNLDALGAIGIARTFECGGAMGAATMAGDDPFCREREPDDRRFSVDHFYTKLLLLAERFYTESGRRKAQQRLTFMREFLAQMAREVAP